MLAHLGQFRRYVTNPIAQASSPPTLAKNARVGHPLWKRCTWIVVKGGPPAKAGPASSRANCMIPKINDRISLSEPEHDERDMLDDFELAHIDLLPLPV